jgi:hypothetical protein
MINVFVEYISTDGDTHIEKKSFKNFVEYYNWLDDLQTQTKDSYWNRSTINVYVVSITETIKVDIPIENGDQRKELQRKELQD